MESGVILPFVWRPPEMDVNSSRINLSLSTSDRREPNHRELSFRFRPNPSDSTVVHVMIED